MGLGAERPPTPALDGVARPFVAEVDGRPVAPLDGHARARRPYVGHLTHGEVRPATNVVLGTSSAAVDATAVLEARIQVATRPLEGPPDQVPRPTEAVRRPFPVLGAPEADVGRRASADVPPTEATRPFEDGPPSQAAAKGILAEALPVGRALGVAPPRRPQGEAVRPIRVGAVGVPTLSGGPSPAPLPSTVRASSVPTASGVARKDPTRDRTPRGVGRDLRSLLRPRRMAPRSLDGHWSVAPAQVEPGRQCVKAAQTDLNCTN